MKLKPNDNTVSLKRFFFLKVLYNNVNQLLKVPFENCFHFNCDTNTLPDNKNHVDLITIAFNNAHVIELQVKYLKKFVRNNYTLLIADNSTKEEVVSKIQAICKRENIGYVRLPQLKNKKIRKMGSYAHASSLNWLYYNYVDKRKPTYFGTLDHDVFPIKDINIISKIDPQGFFGYRRGLSDEPWFIWPGLLFFNYDFISKYHVNYLPSVQNNVYLDTGGSFSNQLYAKLDEKDVAFASFRKIPLRDLGYDNDALVEYIDDGIWFHSANASGWRKEEAYDHLIEDIINREND